MFDYLEGFEKRMGFVAVVESIVNRKNRKQEIENWFEENELDNLFFTLLIYIMEQTLSENDDCTLENMVSFMEQVLPQYGKEFQYDKIRMLTEYMVKDILQNGGTVKNYQAMFYADKMKPLRVRLISDKLMEGNRIIYQLTDQGYDFLFRTKEVDKQLDFKLEQMKLKELLKRKNYKHAVVQSKNLVSMLRQKKRELEDFIYRIRQNIHEIDKSEYERVLMETYTLIDEEYEVMQNIKESIIQDENRINHEGDESGFLDEVMKKALVSLFEIKRNINLVIAEQRNLIKKRFFMNQVYEETIQNSFFASIVKRYDFEKEILEPLLESNEKTIPFLPQLLGPLCLPRVDKILNLKLVYQRQGKLREISEEEINIEEEELKESKALEEIEANNSTNLRIMIKLFQFAGDKKRQFSFSEFYQYLEGKPKYMEAYTENKRIFLIMLKLYENQEIDIDQWMNRSDSELISEANGEFDLAWSLYQLEQHNKFCDIRKLTFEKSEEEKLMIALPGIDDKLMKSWIEIDNITITPFVREIGEML